MPKNPLSTLRKNDEIFERDSAKSTRKRGNQKEYDHTKRWKDNLILFILSFIVCYLLFGFLYGLIHSMIINALKETPMMSNFIDIKQELSIMTATKHMWLQLPNLIFTLITTLIFSIIAVSFNLKYGKRQAVTEDHTDINTYEGDRHILELEELATTYAVFPDAGAHSHSISPSSIVGHVFFKNTGKLKNSVKLAVRNKDGSYKLDKNGNRILKTFDMFDDEIRNEAFKSVGIKSKDAQKERTLDPYKLKYKKVTDKKFGVKTERWMSVGEFIEKDWFIPEYENQRPTGAFFVETGAVNTFAIAITRGNKGQLVVNNTIDNLSREGDPQNMFINDPKGELFAGFHKLLELRGIEPIVLNLMEPSKTHQFNVLGPAVMFARIGDYDQMRSSLNTVMNTFFPVEGDDPFWGNAQQTLVRMIIFALIDYYIEEEHEYLQLYAGKKDASTIARELDDMWSHVTMFNVYQMLTSMSRNEVSWNADEFKFDSDAEVTDSEKVPGENDDDEGEQLTQLTAFLKLLDKLPQNKMRTIAMQQSDAMDVMAESEKTRATIYGIALVAMLFFTDGPITAITCASPRQTLDPMSLAFPRRLRFKVNQSFLKEHALAGRKVVFEAYRDQQMKERIIGGLTREEQDILNHVYKGEKNITEADIKSIKKKANDDFDHETKLDELGWVEYRFKGIFDEYEYEKYDDGTVNKIAKPIYIKMKVINNNSKLTMYTFNFEFKRGFAKTVDGKKFVQNPRTKEKIEQGGTLRMGDIRTESKEGYIDKLEEVIQLKNPTLQMNRMLERFDSNITINDSENIEDGKQKVIEIIKQSDLPERNVFVQNQKLRRLPNGMRVLPIEQTDAVYNIRPKAIFSITPPHLTDYIKIVIMMVAVLFDTSVGESYLTKSSGKPFYKTRSILDELGNMQFNGNGIPAFQTKLSIGLGQGQEYTMILQTLQQLKDVYGDSVDKIVSSNTAVFIYLISNDTDMLEDLSKQAGSTHATRATSKNVVKHVGTVVDTLEDNVTYTYSTQEERLFTVDKLMSFTNGEAMILSSVHRQDNSGEAIRPNPIYNTNETIMPMAYALHFKGHNNDLFKTSVANAEVATSSAGQDVYQSIPDFNEMYKKRAAQARLTQEMIYHYKNQHEFSDQDLMRQNVNELSSTIMRLINAKLNEKKMLEEQKNAFEEDPIAELAMYDDEDDEEDESVKKNPSLSSDDRLILSDNEINMDVINQQVESSFVKDKDKIYQQDLQTSFTDAQREENRRHELIYLDNLISFNDLANYHEMYDILAELLDKTIHSNDDLNPSLPYEFKELNDTFIIRHKDSEKVLAQYHMVEDEQGRPKKEWLILDDFKLLIVDTAKQSSITVTENKNDQNVYKLNKEDVNRLFDFDRNGVVKEELINKIRTEKEKVGNRSDV